MILNKEILEAALIGLEMKKARLEEQIASVKGMTGAKSPRKAIAAADDDWESPAAAPKKAAKGKKKRVMSPEARERIAAAQKKRWAAHRGETV